METSASTGTGLASTRCCQPAASSRLARTWRNPVSESRTARRMGGWLVVGAITRTSIVAEGDAVTPPMPRDHTLVTTPDLTPQTATLLDPSRPAADHRPVTRAQTSLPTVLPGRAGGDVGACFREVPPVCQASSGP